MVHGGLDLSRFKVEGFDDIPLESVCSHFRSFFGWLNKEFKLPNPALDVTPPKFQKTPVDTFTKEEVEKILKACLYSREAQTDERRRPAAGIPAGAIRFANASLQHPVTFFED